MLCAGLTLPRTSGITRYQENITRKSLTFDLDYSLFYYFVLWFALFGLAMIFMIIHGIDYVSWPRLNPLTDIIYYTGPGYRSGHHGKGLGGPHGTLPSWKLLPPRIKRAHRVAVDEVELGTIKKRVD